MSNAGTLPNTPNMIFVITASDARCGKALSVACWDEDEWARGGYAWFKPGQIFSLMPYIARPEGRVHFAGEHTSAWPGYMQGALESGVRAAGEIERAH